jgi:periplasmic protein TonB
MIPTLVPRSNPENDRDHVVVPLAPAPVPEKPLQIEHSELTSRTVERHWIAVSIMAHLLIIGALILGLLEGRQQVPPAVLKITLIPRGPGSAGAAGGKNGGGHAETQQSNQPENAAPPPEPATPAQLPPEKPPPLSVKPDVAQPTQPQIAPPAPAPSPPVETTVPPQLAMEIPVPKPRPPPSRRRAQAHRQTSPVVETPMAPPTEARTEQSAQANTATLPAAAAGVGAGPGKGVEGAGKGAIGSTAGPGDDYLERLYRHLLRYKKYPPEAISAKQQGSAVVGFVIARNGTISDARIEKSSGSPILDQATLTMVQRASPAPALPDSFKASEARVKFPIDYKLSLIDQMF